MGVVYDGSGPIPWDKVGYDKGVRLAQYWWLIAERVRLGRITNEEWRTARRGHTPHGYTTIPSASDVDAQARLLAKEAALQRMDDGVRDLCGVEL